MGQSPVRLADIGFEARRTRPQARSYFPVTELQETNGTTRLTLCFGVDS
jgi:hypothetical protein